MPFIDGSCTGDTISGKRYFFREKSYRLRQAFEAIKVNTRQSIRGEEIADEDIAISYSVWDLSIASELASMTKRALPYPDLAGIYSIGGGVEGIARALEEAGRGQEVVLIGHELTEGTRRLLVAGTIDALIDQNPRVEAREAIDLLVQAAQGTERPVARPMRVHAIFRENLPD